MTSICDERGQELLYAGIPITDIFKEDMGIGGVLSLLWFQRRYVLKVDCLGTGLVMKMQKLVVFSSRTGIIISFLPVLAQGCVPSLVLHAVFICVISSIRIQ